MWNGLQKYGFSIQLWQYNDLSLSVSPCLLSVETEVLSVDSHSEKRNWFLKISN